MLLFEIDTIEDLFNAYYSQPDKRFKWVVGERFLPALVKMVAPSGLFIMEFHYPNEMRLFGNRVEVSRDIDGISVAHDEERFCSHCGISELYPSGKCKGCGYQRVNHAPTS